MYYILLFENVLQLIFYYEVKNDLFLYFNASLTALFFIYILLIMLNCVSMKHII